MFHPVLRYKTILLYSTAQRKANRSNIYTLLVQKNPAEWPSSCSFTRLRHNTKHYYDCLDSFALADKIKDEFQPKEKNMNYRKRHYRLNKTK